MKRMIALTVLACLVIVSTVQAQTVTTNRADFEAAVGTVTCIDFEGFTDVPGQAGAYELTGYEFLGITLNAGVGSEGLFVGIPDPTLSSDNAVSFYGNDFFPTSGVACLSPDFTNAPAPIGTVHVVFDGPVNGVGAYFLDAETAYPNGSYIEVFNENGTSIAKHWIGNQGDDSQAFAGIVATGICSADLALGYGQEGVGLDDLCFGAMRVGIDIKPGSWPNSFNINGSGVIPVAILGSAYFDVYDIDPTSLSFAGLAVRIVGKSEKLMVSYEDVSGGDPEGIPDGYIDMIVQFEDDAIQWEPGEGMAELTGNLYDGIAFSATGYINVVQPVEP